MGISRLEECLSAIPEALRRPLIDEFLQALDEFRAADWEKVGLKCGKFSEIAFCICEGHLYGKFPSAPTKPKNFLQACQKLEGMNTVGNRSLSIQVPRVLIALYELRNNRSIGHVSAEISPNFMDAEFFLRGMKWVVGEFVRNFSSLPVSESFAIVEAVTARTQQVIWSQDDVRRVLSPNLSAKEKTLIILYAENTPVDLRALQSWVEYQNSTTFRRTVILPLHKGALIHFDAARKQVRILPPGQEHVEKSGLLIIRRD